MANEPNADPHANEVSGATPEGAAAVGLVAALLAAGLLAVAPFAAKPVPEGKQWFLAPVNWPVLSLVLMAVTGLALAAPLLRGGYSWTRAGAAFEGMLPALGYSLLFCGYLVLLSFAGFAISSLTFGQLCLWLAGLRSLKWTLWNLTFTAALIVILRIGMGMYFPFAPLFKLMPPWLGNFLGSIL